MLRMEAERLRQSRKNKIQKKRIRKIRICSEKDCISFSFARRGSEAEKLPGLEAGRDV